MYGKVGQSALILAVAAWKGWNTPTGRPYWSLGGQMHYTLVTLVSVPATFLFSYGVRKPLGM